MEAQSFQKELVGFEANDDLLHITSNNQFIVSFDVSKNLSAYEFQTSKQQKMSINLPDSTITDIKLALSGSFFIISFEDGSLFLLDSHTPDKIINKYNYYESIEEKEKIKLQKSNQTCFFRNVTFVDNISFIAVLQKGTMSRFQEQLFKFAIIQGSDSNYSIINYCDYIKFNTEKEYHLIGNPLKIFDEFYHITRISSILIFDKNDSSNTQKAIKLPQLIGISLKKKNKFMIASVNNFRFEIIQSFTADDSISSFAYHQGTNRINVAFTSYSFHMIFIKALTIPNETNQKISISDICTIKLPVIICSNLRSLSFISPDLISIVFTSPGKLNTSIYSINEGTIIGVLPPVSNSNLFLNSSNSVAATFTNNTVFLISKGSALSFSNKDISEMAEKGKFIPQKVEDYVDETSTRSSSLISHFKMIGVKKKDQNEDEQKNQEEQKDDEKEKSPNLKLHSSSRLISFYNNLSQTNEAPKPLPEKQIGSLRNRLSVFQPDQQQQNEKLVKLPSKSSTPKQVETKKEQEKIEEVVETKVQKQNEIEVQEEEEESETQSKQSEEQEQINDVSKANEAEIQEEDDEDEQIQDVSKANEPEIQEEEDDDEQIQDVPDANKHQQQHNEVHFQEEEKENESENKQPEEQIQKDVEINVQQNQGQEENDASLQAPDHESEIENLKKEGKITEGIEYFIKLINEPSSNLSKNQIKSYAIDFLNIYIEKELSDSNCNIQQLSEKVIGYSKQLQIVDEWLLSESVLSTFSKAGSKFKDFLYSIITNVSDSKQIVTNPLFVQYVSQNCDSGFNEETIQKFLLKLIPTLLKGNVPRHSYIDAYLSYAKRTKSYSFAGDVYSEFLHDYSNALSCYEIADNPQQNEKMVKIIINHSSFPSVINWLFACSKKPNSKEMTFPRLSSFLVSKSGNCIINENQSIAILKKVLEGASFYSKLPLIVNALLVTFSKEQISSESQLFILLELFIADSLTKHKNQPFVFSKESLEYLLNEIFTNKTDSNEELLVALLNAKNGSTSIIPDSFTTLYSLYMKCQLLQYSEGLKAMISNFKTKPNFIIQISIDNIISFINKGLVASESFPAELSKKRKELYDYISSQYVKNEKTEMKQKIEKVISKNIVNIICIFSLSIPASSSEQNSRSPPPESPDRFFLQELITSIFTEDFTFELSKQFGENDEILSAFIHSLISSNKIEKSVKLQEIVAMNIINITPFIVMNAPWIEDIKKFIIVSSQYFQDNQIIHDCLSSPKFLNICETHKLFQCCCLLCTINNNNENNEKCIHYLQQLILSLNPKDFTYSQFSSTMNSTETRIDIIDDTNSTEDDNDENKEEDFIDSSFYDEEAVLSRYIELIGKIKYKIDIVKLTAYKLFQDDLKNAWKAFMFLVDVFVTLIKKQSDSIGTYYLEDMTTLFHDICYIMSSNDKNDVDFCEIIRVTRESFSCLCDSLKNRVLKKVISNQVFSPQTIKTIEKNILEKPSQKNILKVARCAKCKMPLFIDGIGVYMFECGHGVHNLAFCRRNGYKCQLCSDLH